MEAAVVRLKGNSGRVTLSEAMFATVAALLTTIP